MELNEEIFVLDELEIISIWSHNLIAIFSLNNEDNVEVDTFELTINDENSCSKLSLVSSVDLVIIVLKSNVEKVSSLVLEEFNNSSRIIYQYIYIYM